LELTNGITLEVRPASFRKLRGPTYVAVIADELAFWYVDGAYANPDVEILNAVEPGLATTGGPLILASSPHARRGVLWEVFKRHYGPGGDPLILVAHGASRTLNPSLSQRVVDRALEKDRARATAEYLAQFRTDVEGFVALEVVESCVGDHREMLPPQTTFTELSLIRAAAPMTASRWPSRTSPRTGLSSMPFARPARRSLLMRWSMTSRRC
jgi:hypothetical protein